MGCGASTPEKRAAAPTEAKRVSAQVKGDAEKPVPPADDKSKQSDDAPKGEVGEPERTDGADPAPETAKQDDDKPQQPPAAPAAPPRAPSSRQGTGEDDQVVDFERGNTDIAGIRASPGPAAVARPGSGQRPASRDPYAGADDDGIPTQTVASSFTEMREAKPAAAPKGDYDDEPAEVEGLEAPSAAPAKLKSTPSDGFG